MNVDVHRDVDDDADTDVSPGDIHTHLRPAARQLSAVPPPVDPIDAQPHAIPDWHPIVVAAMQPHRCAAPSPVPSVAAVRVACAAYPARCRAPCLSMNIDILLCSLHVTLDHSTHHSETVPAHTANWSGPPAV